MSPSGQISARTVKRRIYAPAHRAVAAAGPGFTQEAETELRFLLDGRITPSHLNPTINASHGNVLIRSVDYRTLLELVLRSSCATDIGMMVGSGTAQGEKELSSLFSSIDWNLFLSTGNPTRIRLRAEAHASRIYHTGLIRELLGDALRDHGSVELVEEEESDQVVSVRLVHNRAQVALSLNGLPLWKRGYRASMQAVAPLREDLAQSAIRRSLRWSGALNEPEPAQGFDTIVVPFAGTGTLAFESLIALGMIPPFLFRGSDGGSDGYAFERFAFGTPPSVPWLKRVLRERMVSRLAAKQPPRVVMIDSYAPACEAAQANLDRFTASLGGPVFPTDVFHEDCLTHSWDHFVEKDSHRLFIPMNPPYGLRVRTREASSLYQRIGRKLDTLHSRHAHGIAGFILCPDEHAWHAFMRATSSFHFETSHFSQGGLDIRLCAFHN